MNVRRVGFVASVVLAVVSVAVAGARASQITVPGARYVATTEANGALAPFTIVATGFAPGTRVFVEQCDDTSPSDPQWSPTIDCDLGTSPAGANADAGGRVTFDARDRNHAFRPFRGTSPEGLFNCLGAHQPSPHNGLLDSRTCMVRVSTTNSAATSDQIFLALVLPDPPGTSSVHTSGATTGATPASGPSPTGTPASETNGPSSVHAASASSHGSGPSSLAFTGGFTLVLFVVGLESVAIGMILMGRRRSRVRALRR